jgi:anti-sigma regulatory factor (Ser/Thr protein kinase)
MMSTDVHELSFRHAADPPSISRARHEIESALSNALVDASAVGDVMLLVSELATNAVRHTETDEFEVRLRVLPDRLRIEVWDDGDGFEPVVAPSDDGSGGYGLFLLDRIADRWGVEHDPHTAIWLEVDRV